MALNLDIIGRNSDPVAFSYDQDRVILYALGIGAGVEELEFIYEKGLKVLPTFAVIAAQDASMAVTDQAGLNMPAVLYAGHKVALHAPIPVAGSLYSTAVCSSIYDKGDSGAVLNLKVETRSPEGRLLFENEITIIDRSAGNFGGQRGPKPEKVKVPEGKAPDFHIDYETSAQQAATYRLSGDKNPIHIDPQFSIKAGFSRPILHGLCSFGFTGRAVLKCVCENETARFKAFAAMFKGVVYPGETLIVEGWKVSEGSYLVQTKTGDGRIVLGNAIAEIL